MAITVTATQSSVKLRLATGTSASGATTTKTVSLFSSGLQKASLTDSELEAAYTLITLLEACLLYTVEGILYEATSSVAVS